MQNENLKEIKDQKLMVEAGDKFGDWFVFREDRHFGPLSTKQVKGFLAKDFLSKNHHIWRPGFESWVKINSVESLRSYCGNISKDMSDDEFSKKARIEGIDFINLENKSLSFIESKSQQKVEGAFTSFKNLSFQAFEKIEGVRFLIVAAVLVGLVGVASLYRYQKSNPVLSSLSSDMKAQMLQAVEAPYENGLKFLVDQTSVAGDPVFVVGTNLPKGSKLELSLLGYPETLVGSYRFERLVEFKTNGGVLKSPAIRQLNGEYIPPGTYDVNISCVNCETEKLLYANKMQLNVKDEALYAQNLEAFHAKARKAARLELEELDDLYVTLKSQYQGSLEKFVPYSNGNQKTKWKRYSKSWLSDQNKIVDLFAQLKSDSFRKNLYYEKLYGSYAKVSEKIFEMHLMQDSIILTEKRDDVRIEQAAQLSQSINFNLQFLKSQLDLMNVNFAQSEGLPSKEGLVLKSFK